MLANNLYNYLYFQEETTTNDHEAALTARICSGFYCIENNKIACIRLKEILKYVPAYLCFATKYKIDCFILNDSAIGGQNCIIYYSGRMLITVLIILCHNLPI